MRVPAWPGSVEGSFFGLQTAKFLYFHKAERERALWPLLIRTLILLMRASPSWLNYLAKTSPWIPSHWKLDFSTWILERHKHSVYNRLQQTSCEISRASHNTAVLLMYAAFCETGGFYYIQGPHLLLCYSPAILNMASQSSWHNLFYSGEAEGCEGSSRTFSSPGPEAVNIISTRNALVRTQSSGTA